MTMNIQAEQIVDFSKKNLKRLIDSRIEDYAKLGEAEKHSLFTLFCAIATGADKFVTATPFILDNRDDLHKHIKLRIITLEEALQIEGK